eukprot:Cvel_21353.t1-p1 / transcript=Cvel_21353.t1 / gene=Cvel_21353 / organism=Chromera_velia_CCMP2878 / gene_product=hypothetical protein / transcript_product=hypothetical protein / location=Cvel_scaffold1995:312-1470(-) / protein_length=75 / sequence_SO=supercontig / SO=protein_coding / is_pseudo=false
MGDYDVEHFFAEEVKKSEDKSSAVLDLVRSLGSALVYPESTNIETNRKLWNQYAKQWDPGCSWVQRMNSSLPVRP